jgi:hypothetical protein
MFTFGVNLRGNRRSHIAKRPNLTVPAVKKSYRVGHKSCRAGPERSVAGRNAIENHVLSTGCFNRGVLAGRSAICYRALNYIHDVNSPSVAPQTTSGRSRRSSTRQDVPMANIPDVFAAEISELAIRITLRSCLCRRPANSLPNCDFSPPNFLQSHFPC